MSKNKEVSTEEIWRDVPGHEGMYQVSNFGRVRSWWNNRHGKAREPRVLKPIKSKNGYKYISLTRRNRKLIHRLVAEAFVSNSQNKPQVNHIDGDKWNNHASNLEWCTNRENATHAVNHDLLPSGSKRWNAKLSEKEAREVKRLINTTDLNNNEISKRMGGKVGRGAIRGIRIGKSWRKINKPKNQNTL